MTKYRCDVKIQSSQWKLPEESRLKKLHEFDQIWRLFHSILMAVVHHKFLQYNRMINKEYYCSITHGTYIMILFPLTPHCSCFFGRNQTIIMSQPPYLPDMNLMFCHHWWDSEGTAFYSKSEFQKFFQNW